MNIAVLSDCRVPTRGSGSHGLGRAAFDLARALLEIGHSVTFYAGPGSQSPDGVPLVMHDNESGRAREWTAPFDAAIDLSHYKELSLFHPELKVVNWVLDGECRLNLPRAATAGDADGADYPRAKRIPVGIDAAQFPFFPRDARGDYLAFVARIHPEKGVHEALMVHTMQRRLVRFVGEMSMGGVKLPDWRARLDGADYHNFVGRAFGWLGLLTGGRGQSRALLEAQAMGTPAIVSDRVWHHAETIRHCETGFVVRSPEEAAEAVEDLALIRPEACRELVVREHSLEVMARAAERALTAAADGEDW